MHHGGVDFLATCRAARDFLIKRRVVSGASTITQQLIKISSPPAHRGPAHQDPRSPRRPATSNGNGPSAGNPHRLPQPPRLRQPPHRCRRGRRVSISRNPSPTSRLPSAPCSPAFRRLRPPQSRFAIRSAPSPAETSFSRVSRPSVKPIPHASPPLSPSLSTSARSAKPSPPLAPALTPPSVRLGRPQTTSPAAPQSASRIPPCDVRNAKLPEPRSLGPQAPNLPSKPHPSGQQRKFHISNMKYVPLSISPSSGTWRPSSARRRRNSASANLRHAAVVVIDNPTGEILALVSSADWRDPRGGQLNGALVPRSPGSALKPFTYLLAMERNRLTPASIIADIPSPFRTPQGLDLPENYDRAYRGPVTLRSGARLLAQCPRDARAQRARRPRAASPPAHPTRPQHPRRRSRRLRPRPHHRQRARPTAGTHQRLRHPRPRRALAAAGPVSSRRRGPPDFRLPFSATSFYLIADILSDPAARAPGILVRRPARPAIPLRGENRHLLGFPRQLVPRLHPGFHGRRLGRKFRKPADERHLGSFRRGADFPPHHAAAPPRPRPDMVFAAGRDWWTSRSIREMVNSSPPGPKHARAELAPARPDSAHRHRRRLRFLRQGPARPHLRRLVRKRRTTSAAPNSPSIPRPSLLEPLKIITPADNATFLLDPEIPSGSDKLRPVTNLPGTARWTSPTLHIDPATPEPVIHLDSRHPHPNRHRSPGRQRAKHHAACEGHVKATACRSELAVLVDTLRLDHSRRFHRTLVSQKPAL